MAPGVEKTLSESSHLSVTISVVYVGGPASSHRARPDLVEFGTLHTVPPARIAA